ncbi:MAG: hypothetical protein KF774_10900 [Planctomyces sp.]|nr:hypothetical protein [Planctomyces sp.]
MKRFATLLWRGAEPIGICLFVSPPRSLSGRNRFFGRSGRWSRLSMKMLNRSLVMLSRVVLHPTYRGAGIAAAFVRRSCELCPFRWIETLAGMGRINPFFERAGFVRVGTADGPAADERSRRQHSRIFGGRTRNGRRGLVSRETFEKSRHSRPVYYVFDNRRTQTRPGGAGHDPQPCPARDTRDGAD